MKPIQPSQEMLRKLHVITVISNPVRYHSRYELYRNFRQHMESAGAQLWTAEVAFGDRPFEITTGNVCSNREVQFRSFDEIWLKEALFNQVVSRLPLDWEYVCLIDADVMFQNPYWLTETVQKLQHVMVCQMFGEAIDLGPKHEIMQTHRGFVKGYIDEGYQCPNMKNKDWGYYGYGPTGSFAHPGFAWAFRREALQHLGGMIDFAIAGSADHHAAMALIGQVEKTFPPQIHSRYVQKLVRWQDRALKHLHKDIGFVDGTISHFFHGRKAQRKYKERWSILIDNNFDPDVDLKRDTQGLWTFTDDNIRLRDEMRAYFASRNEDGTEA